MSYYGLLRALQIDCPVTVRARPRAQAEPKCDSGRKLKDPKFYSEQPLSELKKNRVRKRAIFFETVSKLLRNNVQNCVEMECEGLQKLTKGI